MSEPELLPEPLRAVTLNPFVFERESAMSRIAFVFTLVVAGCTTNPESASHEEKLGDPACHAEGAICYYSGQCCTGYCDSPSVYASGHCAQPQPIGSACMRDDECQSLICRSGKCEGPQPEGAFCWGDRECQSKVCYNYQCSPLGCFSDGGGCSWNGACCSGYCDGANAYAGGECTAPQAPGSYCIRNNECLSRSCSQNRCQASGLPQEP